MRIILDIGKYLFILYDEKLCLSLIYLFCCIVFPMCDNKYNRVSDLIAQSLYSLDQVKQFILASVSVTDQGTKESSSSLYNKPHRGAYILSPDPSTLSDHLTTTMVDVPPSGSCLLIIDPFGSEYYIRIDS